MSPSVPRTVAGLALAGAGCVAYGSLVERQWYRLRRLRIDHVLRRPGTLRILHLTDLHLVPGRDHLVAFLRSLAGLDHDVVVVTGDLLGAPGAEDLAADSLAPLTSDGRPGLVVLGSNDLFGPVCKAPWSYLSDPERRTFGTPLDTERLIERLAASGYRTLATEAATVETPSGTIAVGGLEDPHLETTRLPEPAVVAPPQDREALLHLGLVHAPYLAALDVLVEAGHDLLLAGHTHGGQVRLPGFGALVANCDLPLAQVRGLSRYRDSWLHVSAGLGYSRYAPFRFACRPEATVLELTG
ncbi:MAG: metallophosphoesterase [Nitriliruptoraceae bacterium]